MLVVVALSGLLGCQGLSTPSQLTPAPTSIRFGNVQIGASHTQAGAITNKGPSSISVAQVAVSGAGYSIRGLTAPLTLAAGKSTSFSVIFAPTNAGGANGNIAVRTEKGTANIALLGWE
jgi:hypothetical protein